MSFALGRKAIVDPAYVFMQKAFKTAGPRLIDTLIAELFSEDFSVVAREPTGGPVAEIHVYVRNSAIFFRLFSTWAVMKCTKIGRQNRSFQEITPSRANDVFVAHSFTPFWSSIG